MRLSELVEELKIATLANVRTTSAARSSLNKALAVAFSGGAVMGMVVPAGLYIIINNVGEGGDIRGWAIPSATDIAFALAVLAVIGSSRFVSDEVLWTRTIASRDASALAWIFFFVMFVFTYVQFRASRRWVYYAGEVD